MSVAFDVSVPLPEYIESDTDARDLLYLLMNKVREEPDDYIGFDTETHGKKIELSSKAKKGGSARAPLDWMSDTITFWSLSARIYDQWHRWCLPQEHFQYFTPLMENPKALFACYNAKYDAHISWNCRVNIWNARIHDGLVMMHLHDENRNDSGLKSVCAEFLGLRMTPYKALFATDNQGNKAQEYLTSLYDLPIEKVSDYASYDAFAHAQICIWLRDRLMNTPLNKHGYNLFEYFMDWEQPYTEILWRMERRGLDIDTEYLKEMVPELDEQIRKIEFRINRVAGKPINLNSTDQLAWLLFDPTGPFKLKPVKMTKGGKTEPKPSTDKEVMTALEEAGIDIAVDIRKLRSLTKTKGTYFTALIELSEWFEDGRIHPNMKQTGTSTGRLSTQNPNSQNLPRADGDEWGIRRAFIAVPGDKLIVADYGQLEMRIMAHMAQDRRMIEAILEGKDLHSYTVGEMIADVAYEEVVEAKKAGKDANERQKWLQRQRQSYKAVGFGLIYGAREAKLAQQIDMSDEEVEERLRMIPPDTMLQKMEKKIKRLPLLTKEKARIIVAREDIAHDKIEGYFKVFQGVKRYMDLIPAQCRGSMVYDFEGNLRKWDFCHRDGSEKKLSETGHSYRFGFVQTLCGRMRRFNHIDHKNFFFRAEAERQGINMTIQGSAGDICKGAMIRVEHNEELHRLGAEMLNQIHDELVLRVPTANAEAAAEIIKENMENPFGPGVPVICVPLPVDLTIVDNWAMAK